MYATGGFPLYLLLLFPVKIWRRSFNLLEDFYEHMISIIKFNGFGQPSENLLSIPQQALLHFEVALEYDHEILDSRTQQI